MLDLFLRSAPLRREVSGDPVSTCAMHPPTRLAPTSLPPAACVHLKGPAKSRRCVTALTAREVARAVRRRPQMHRAIAAYGQVLSREEVHARVFGALDRRVLGPHNAELRAYFERCFEQCASPFGGTGQDDAISSSSDDDIEQTALLFCHHDTDGDGVLSRDEFAAVVDMVAGTTGQRFTVEHVDRCFQQADVDGSGAIDLNELLLYRTRAPAAGLGKSRERGRKQ